jgi:lysylphosphatidylglycerol synthetase-like protein (DUF2156 family)
MRVLDYVLAGIIFGLGIVHCLVTFAQYKAFTLGAVWFFGAGLALLFLGMLNLLRIRHGRLAWLRPFAAIANLLTLALAAAVAMKMDLPSNPQALVLLLALAGESWFSLWNRR